VRIRHEQTALRLVRPDEALWDGPMSLEAVYRRYSPYVARVALRLLGRAADVEDLVQDVFVAATRGIRGLRDAEAIRGWLAVITVRMVRRKLRLRRAQQFFGWGPELDVEIGDASEALAYRGASGADRAVLSAVYRVLAEMPSDDRVAWALHQIEGETLESVARLCRCSLATAKRRIARVQVCIEERFSRD
jgi:RNA polymerase sigma-70 factor (ECF subfamily)